jgi:ribulose kinase
MVGSANMQAFDTIPFLTQNALFPDWWMNEGGQSATGEVRFSTPHAHIVAHNRTTDSAS